MRARRPSPGMFLLVASLTAVSAGCGDEVADGPRVPIKVMTYNLYLGSALTSLALTTADGIPMAAAALYANVVASEFPERAKVLAAAITAAAPDLVGLQEVSLYRKQTPSDFAPGASTPNATEVWLDFLALLMAEIEARGGHYKVVNEAMNADAELPVDAGAEPPFDLRLTDRDVILARDGADVEISNPTAATFSNRFMLPVGGPGGVLVDFRRGYSTVTATVGGATLTFGNSHLEIGTFESIQVEQAKEVVAGLTPVAGPIILVGDFNSRPGASPMNSYAQLSAQFRDAYTGAQGAAPGQTCCQADNLKNPASMASERIDLIMYRGDFRPSDAVVVGSDPATGRTEGGLWASDHFGVAATLNLRP